MEDKKKKLSDKTCFYCMDDKMKEINNFLEELPKIMDYINKCFICGFNQNPYEENHGTEENPEDFIYEKRAHKQCWYGNLDVD